MLFLNYVTEQISFYSIQHDFQFIWNGKDKIKRSVLTNDYEKGGLKMTNLELYIKAQQIICLKKYWLDYPSTWKQILDFHFKDYGGKFLLQCNPDLTLLKNVIPPFYLNCLKTWVSLR